MFRSNRFYLVIILLAVELSAAIVGEFIGSDPYFEKGVAVSIELLESGEEQQAKWGSPFELQLPFDTIWNICVVELPEPSSKSSPEKGESADLHRERCYEITAHLPDSSRLELQLEPSQLSPHFVASEPLEQLAQAVATAENDLGTSEESAAASEEIELQADEVVERSTRLQKVQVRVKKRPQRALGQSVVSAKSIKRMPSLGEADVVKAIQALPGVVASSDFSSKIYVRGGSSDQNLFLFDNGVVFSPVHFFGLFSTFLVEGVDQVEFYKGGFPARYGNRLSSVVDVQSRVGGSPDSSEWFHQSSLKVSSFSAQAHTEGHKGNLRWLVAGRATYLKETLDAMRAAGLTDLDLNYRFFDLQGNIQWSPDPSKNALFSWYAGEDRLDFDPFLVSWGNTVLPVNFKWELSDQTTFKMSYAYSLFHQTFALAGLMEMINDNSTQMFKPTVEHQLQQQLQLEFGVEAQLIDAIFSMEQESVSLSIADGGTLWLVSPLAQLRWTPELWEITAGVRGNLSTESSLPTVEPRFSLRRMVGDRQKIDFHLGLYYQYLNSIMLGDMENLNEFYFPSMKSKHSEIPPSRSLLFSLGYTREKLPFGFVGIAEFYFKTLDDLLVLDAFAAPDSVRYDVSSKIADFVRQGEGYSYGAELSLRRDEGKVVGGVSYSWGRSILNDGREVVYANWDRRHALKVDVALQWRGEEGIWPYAQPKDAKRYFRSSMQVGWNSGFPYSEIVGYIPRHQLDQGESQPFETVPGPRNGIRYPNYFRWDIKPIDIGVEGSWNLSWTILNITDHRNIFLYAYDQNKIPPERLEIPQFPFFPVLISYELYF